MRVDRSKPLADFSGEEPCAILESADTACAKLGWLGLNAPKCTADEGDLEEEVTLFLMYEGVLLKKHTSSPAKSQVLSKLDPDSCLWVPGLGLTIWPEGCSASLLGHHRLLKGQTLYVFFIRI